MSQRKSSIFLNKRKLSKLLVETGIAAPILCELQFEYRPKGIENGKYCKCLHLFGFQDNSISLNFQSVRITSGSTHSESYQESSWQRRADIKTGEQMTRKKLS